jgi:hypothetical protein
MELHFVATNGKIDFIDGIGIANRQSGTTINLSQNLNVNEGLNIYRSFNFQLYEQKVRLKS